jgi:hypothetical protein
VGPLLLAMALASMSRNQVFAQTAAPAAAVLHPVTVDFTGFVFDPLHDMRRLGVRVVITKQVDEAGAESIAVLVYDRERDAYGDTYWQERTALCRPATSEPPPPPTGPDEPSKCCVLFDRFHPPEEEDSGYE